MHVLVGLDLSNNKCGVGALLSRRGFVPRRPPKAVIEMVRSTRAAPRATARDVVTRVREIAGAARLSGLDVAIEWPPETLPGDHKRGRQGGIGLKLGYLIGLVDEGLRTEPRCTVELVEVSPWRQTMLELTARWGEPRAKPGSAEAKRATEARSRSNFRVVREAADIVVIWSDCGHRERYPASRAMTGQPFACPQCAAGAARGMSEAEARTDEWKRLACELAAVHWPDAYRRVVHPARERARTERPDHRLEGVSDACEAVWVAAHLLKGGT